MTQTLNDIRHLLSTQGIVVRRQHPELDAGVAYLARKGELKRLLPGIYAPAASASKPRIRMQALMAYDQDAVLTEAAAASVSFWPTIAVGPSPAPSLTIAVSSVITSSPAGPSRRS